MARLAEPSHSAFDARQALTETDWSAIPEAPEGFSTNLADQMPPAPMVPENWPDPSPRLGNGDGSGGSFDPDDYYSTRTFDLLGRPEEKEFRPYGGAYAAFKDRRDVVGISGPAGTGKSRLFLEKLHLICEKYPGARCLIARKTRESLTEAALFTLEEKVFPVGHPALEGAQRNQRQHYNYPNGASITVVGLDKPQKVMSTEYDVIYVQEFTECDRNDLDMLSTRLRNGVVPYQQLLFDCNPDKPTHWIWQAATNGEFPLYASVHEDNPTLWKEAPRDTQRDRASLPPAERTTPDWPLVSPDGRVGRYTRQGREYLAKLDKLKGARYKRLRLGLWSSAEGGVYEDDWDASIHMPDPFPVIQRHWRRVWVVDFGFTVPLVVQMAAIDDDGRILVYREFYHTRVLVRDAAAACLASCGWRMLHDSDGRPTGELIPIPGVEQDELPDTVVCDTDAEGVETFESETGLHTTNAYKQNVIDGIQAVKTRLEVAGDGRPRLMYRRGAVIKLDPALKDNAKPQSSAEEYDGYIWDTTNAKKGDKVLAVDDHGMDATRYLVCEVDNIRDAPKAKDVAQAAGSYGCMVTVIRQNRDRRMQNGEGRRQGTQNTQTTQDGDGDGYGTAWRAGGGRRPTRARTSRQDADRTQQSRGGKR